MDFSVEGLGLNVFLFCFVFRGVGYYTKSSKIYTLPPKRKKNPEFKKPLMKRVKNTGTLEQAHLHSL